MKKLVFMFVAAATMSFAVSFSSCGGAQTTADSATDSANVVADTAAAADTATADTAAAADTTTAAAATDTVKA